MKRVRRCSSSLAPFGLALTLLAGSVAAVEAPSGPSPGASGAPSGLPPHWKVDAETYAAYCEKNPERCARAEAELRAQCDADPEACRRAHGGQAPNPPTSPSGNPSGIPTGNPSGNPQGHDAACADDPAACAAEKARLRNKIAPAGETPPTIPPRPKQ